MVILGIDPGTATTGWGILKKNGKGYAAVEWGLIETKKENTPPKRLISIYTQLSNIIKYHRPNVVAIERLFFATNAKTAMRVGQAQGVMLYAAARKNISVYEYAPGTIKKVVSGNGRSSKKEMQQAIRKYFGARVRSRKNAKTHFDNAADALAVALCHTIRIKGGE